MSSGETPKRNATAVAARDSPRASRLGFRSSSSLRPGSKLTKRNGPGADGILPVARAHLAGPLREDRGGRVGDDGGEEGDRLFEVDEELGGRDDVKAFQVGRLAGDQAPGAADGRQQPPVDGRRQEEALPGGAHVARRDAPPVVETDARPQPETVPRGVGLDQDLRGEPGGDARAFEGPGQRLEETGHDLALFERLALRRVERPDDAGDRDVENAAACPPVGARPIRPRPRPCRARRS